MTKTHLSISKLIDLISSKKPPVIFLTGKTCTGKSTLAKDLSKLGYKHLELDSVISESVVKRFDIHHREGEAFLVYKGSTVKEWQDAFESASKDLINQEIKNSNLIIDAAIANVDIIKRIFDPYHDQFTFIYLHPFTKKLYYQNISNRLDNDFKTNTRSFPIWNQITQNIRDEYTQSGIQGKTIQKLIIKYGEDSIKRSESRYENFKKSFPNIILAGR